MLTCFGNTLWQSSLQPYGTIMSFARMAVYAILVGSLGSQAVIQASIGQAAKRRTHLPPMADSAALSDAGIGAAGRFGALPAVAADSRALQPAPRDGAGVLGSRHRHCRVLDDPGGQAWRSSASWDMHRAGQRPTALGSRHRALPWCRWCPCPRAPHRRRWG